MTQTISYGSSFNVSTAFVPDIYEIVVPPTAYFGGTPTSVGAATGTASWGQKNYPTLVGNPAQIVSAFGGINSAALTDVHDLCTGLTQAMNQVNTSSGIMLYGIRVSDGTDTQAQCTVYNGTSETITFTGSTTTGDVVNLLFTNTNLPNGSYNLQYTLVSGDSTLTLLATHITSAITASTTLANAGFTATSSGAAITISWAATQGGVSIASAINGTTTVTVGGTITATDVLTITVVDANLVGGSYAVPYTVQSGDSTTTIATAFKNLINADTNLSSIGVTATSSTAVLSIKSVDSVLTTYTKATSSGATETLTIAAGPTEIATITPPSAGMTVKAKWTGIMGNQIAVSIQPGSASGTLTLIVSPFPGGGSNEIFANLPGGASTFWAAAQNAINLGLTSSRGPSNFITITGATPTTSAPVTGTYTLAGGTDGRSAVTSAELVGTQAPATGIYTLVTPNVQFPPSVLWVVGLTDSTVYPAINSFCQQNNIFSLFTFASGTSVASAVSAKQSYGISNYSSGFILGWVYWFDQVNNQVRLTPPTSTAAGAICTLPPWASPLNTSVLNVLGTEQNNPYTGNTPYAYSDLNSLGQAGIMTFTNPIPAGNTFGFRNGFNSIGNNQPNGTVEYSRLTNYIVVTNGQLLGPFLGQMQTLASNDPTRAKVQTVLNSFFQSLQQSGYISTYNVLCDTTNNTQLSVAMGELAINELVTYNGTIMYILVDVQGGVTVVANANQSGSQLIGS